MSCGAQTPQTKSWVFWGTKSKNPARAMGVFGSKTQKPSQAHGCAWMQSTKTQPGPWVCLSMSGHKPIFKPNPPKFADFPCSQNPNPVVLNPDLDGSSSSKTKKIQVQDEENPCECRFLWVCGCRTHMGSGSRGSNFLGTHFNPGFFGS